MSGTDPGSRFISEADIEEARKQREEAWKKAYESNQGPPPEGSADPAYDPRTLYERLQEQRRRKEDAFAESRRHANLIRKLDADESEFLETVEDREQEKLADQKRAEMVALAAFKERVAEKQQAAAAATGNKRKPVAAGPGGAGGRRNQISILDRIGSVVAVKGAESGKTPERERAAGAGDDVDGRGAESAGALGGFLAAYQGASDSSDGESDGESDDSKGGSDNGDGDERPGKKVRSR